MIQWWFNTFWSCVVQECEDLINNSVIYYESEALFFFLDLIQYSTGTFGSFL